MRDLLIELTEDVANKGKGSIFWAKGNRAAKLINRGLAKIAEKGTEPKILPSKELIEFNKKVKKSKK